MKKAYYLVGLLGAAVGFAIHLAYKPIDWTITESEPLVKKAMPLV